jgi:hypothetical protein
MVVHTMARPADVVPRACSWLHVAPSVTFWNTLAGTVVDAPAVKPVVPGAATVVWVAGEVAGSDFLSSPHAAVNAKSTIKRQRVRRRFVMRPFLPRPR